MGVGKSLVASFLIKSELTAFIRTSIDSLFCVQRRGNAIFTVNCVFRAYLKITITLVSLRHVGLVAIFNTLVVKS
jgi:hypothetical protein